MKLFERGVCLGAFFALAIVSCKEKPKTEEKVETPAEVKEAVKEEVKEEVEDVKEVVEEVKETVVEPVKEAKLGAEERAAKLGFAQYLPAETEMLLTVYNSKDSFERFKSLKLYGFMENAFGMSAMQELEMEVEENFIEEEMEEEQGEVDIEEEEEFVMEEPPSPWILFGQEFTIGFGAGSGDQVANLLTLSDRMGYIQAKALGKALEAMAKSGNENDFSDSFAESMDGEAILMEFINDEKAGIGLLEKAVMPTIYLAFKAKEGELEKAAGMLNEGMALFAQAGEMVAPVEFETGGGKFSGFKLLGAKVAEMMETEKEEMVEQIGAEKTDAIISEVTKKNLFFVTGTVGDYVVFMIGGDEAQMKLSDGVEGSLAGSAEFNFIDGYADKKLVTVAYGDSEVLETVIDAAGGLGTYAIGLRDGMMEGDGLGDIRDITELLDMIVEREKELLSMISYTDSGTVVYLEEGLKIESFGGIDDGRLAWDQELKLAHLGEDSNNMMFLNYASSPEYNKKVGAYLETIFEMAYAVGMKVSDMEMESEDFKKMKKFAKMFDEKFREDALGIYEAMSGDMSDALGNEVAFLIDLEGAVPAIPGLPQEVVDGGKAPRMTILSPVTERAKLAAAWTEINSRTSNLLNTVSEMAEEEIPMQKPISSEKDGVTTWFISFPFFQDDFMPSVSVSDEWFAASTSKTQALDLISKANKGGESGSGLEMRINFDSMADYADEMLAMVDKNTAVIFTEEHQIDGFNETKVQMKEFLEAFREFESLSWDVRKENGMIRSSMHFKVR
jgi:hypothetical protein